MAKAVQKESKIVYLQIGQNYENLGLQKQFDVSEWVEEFPNAHIYLLFKRPGEEAAAPVNTELDENGILTWTVSNWETGIIGVGFAEIRAIDTETGLVKKSHVIPCSVEASITDEDTHPDYPSWVDRMITMNEHLESVYDDFDEELTEGVAAIQQEAATQKQTAVDAIQAKGETVIASIPSSYTDLIEALAGYTYNPNRHYDHGEFCWYDDKLWRRREDSAAIVGSWVEADWIEAPLTSFMAELGWDMESYTEQWGAMKAALYGEGITNYESENAYTAGAIVWQFRSNLGDIGFYRAKVDKPAGDPWVAANWEKLVGIDDKYVALFNEFVMVQNAQPDTANNRIWVQPQNTEYQVPTYAEFTALDDDVTDLKSAINDVVPLPINSWIPQYCIQCPTSATVGDEISLAPVSNANMLYMIIDVVAGDTFIATGRGNSGYLGWFQVDTNGRCVQIGTIIYNNATIVITEPGKLVLNANRNNSYSAYKGTNKVEENRNLINSLQSTVEKTTVDDESVLFSLYRKEYQVVKTNTAISLAGKAVGDTLDLTPSAASNFGYLIIPCTDNETFILTANAGSGNYPWACLDANNVILSIASGATVAKATIITPTNTAKLVIRANCNSTVLVVRGRGIVNDLNGEEQILSLSVAAGYWSINGSGSSASSYRRTENSIFYRAGTTFKIYASANGTATTGALITEWDSAGNFIQTLVSASVASEQTVYSLDHDAYIRFSYNNSYGFSGTISFPTSSEIMSTVSKTQGAVESTLYEWERVLNSVCCIGDSLTRGAYFVNGHDGSAIEQNYPYFFAKQTGLTVQNEGMSGSSPSSRWPYFSTFDFTPYNAFFIWWGTNGGLTDTLEADGVVDGQGNLIADYTTYADTNTGDYCKVIGKIIQQVPHAKIFLGTIYTTSADRNITNSVIQKIAELYPDNIMGVVDNNDGTLYTLASKKLTPSWVHIDNITHFSMVGNYYLAVHWIRAVRNIISANPARFEDIMEDILD